MLFTFLIIIPLGSVFQYKTGVERIEKLINKIIKSYSIHTVLLKIHSIVIEKSLSEGFFFQGIERNITDSEIYMYKESTVNITLTKRV